MLLPLVWLTDNDCFLIGPKNSARAATDLLGFLCAFIDILSGKYAILEQFTMPGLFNTAQVRTCQRVLTLETFPTARTKYQSIVEFSPGGSDADQAT